MADELTIERDAPNGDEFPPLRDENDNLSAAFMDELVAAIEAQDAGRARALTADVHEADVGAILEQLDPDQRPALIQLLGDAFDFTALTELDETTRVEILEELPPETVAEGMRELDSDDAVYILEDLDKEDRDEILAQIPPVERLALNRSLDYPEESAGRRMQTDFIAVAPFWTVGQTIDYMRDAQDLPESFHEIFVVDPAFHILGTVSLDRLLRAKRPVKVSDLVNEARHLIHATDDQEAAARLFQRYNLISAAVVDESDRLVGVLTIDDIVDVIQQEADEDIKRLGGVGDEEVSDRVWSIARSRFPWLFINLMTALAASFVIGLFQGELQKMVALAVLMPIVASQGGNAGTQTMTVAVRALAMRELGPHNVLRVVGRELVVGIMNGFIFAAIVGAMAVYRFGVADLGFVIAAAMMINLIAAALGGILIPLGLNRLKVDPAIASSAFVTTITDIVGFFSFLGFAALWFGKM
ncbi:magnesium transporter [Kaistia dalseonensis]|uniref:Magnesium transporter MgtE n=1 Tax=Kaistia dalseonensis TaxID=410840 RepID=A0ABU0H143_9HYPH|nr:magnesium transporter [Kaistia dalseonensis]MCX5493466.1 magnesium transporter [Kaistia dalseonensis]MDQ0436025.1 magnesium transporter [Kaistia dalseonensis]